MIKVTITIKELPNGNIACDVQPDRNCKATRGEAYVGNIMRDAVNAGMDAVAQDARAKSSAQIIGTSSDATGDAQVESIIAGIIGRKLS